MAFNDKKGWLHFILEVVYNNIAIDQGPFPQETESYKYYKCLFELDTLSVYIINNSITTH